MMMCDGLAKHMSEANVNLVLTAMKGWRCIISKLGDEEAYRQELKQKGLGIKRLKGRSTADIAPPTRRCVAHMRAVCVRRARVRMPEHAKGEQAMSGEEFGSEAG